MKRVYTTLALFIITATVFSQTSYYVNDNSTTGDVFTSAVGNDLNVGTAAAPFATLAKAYQTAVAGDIIYMDAGTYDNIANGPVAKSLTFRGANYLISPNDPLDPLLPNGGRNTETIITNTSFTIAASNVTFSGFLFNPGINIQFDQNSTTLDYDNINLSKNIFRNTSGNAPIRLRGKNNTPLVSFNYSILDNRFIKEVATPGTSVVINAVDGVQIQNNTFTVSADIANRTEADIAINSSFRCDNVVISQNIAYRQNNLVSSMNALHARIDFNKAIECNRFSNVAIGLSDPCIVDISDNIVTDPKGGASSIAYQRNNGFNVSSPNIARIERNTITLNGTGLSTIPTALISAGLNDNTQNSQVYIRDNKLSFSGNFGSLSNASAFIAGINFLNNSRQAVVERNEIEFNASNYNTNNKNGIYILHFNLLAGANFDILNNKVSGFPTSFAIQQNIPSSATDVGPFGQLPDWASVNAHNNSFANDVLSINNGTQSHSIDASCNWYGSAAAQDFINKLTLSTVDIVPWLTDGTDVDPAIGFQPVAGACDNGYPTLITLDSYTDVTCNGANNGTINITTTYGRTPFTYTWTKDGDSEFISHDEDLANLSPGTYHLALVDGNGSNIYITDPEADGPGTIDVTITEPSVLSATASGTNVSCFNGSDGTATVIPAGGTEPYTYLWNNGQTTQSISNLVAGTYSVTITDDNGCTTTAQYIVTQPTLLTAVATGTSTSCSNSATVVASGGTAPYSYSWSNEATTQSITSLPAGTYSVTVTDAKGCTTSASCTVTASEAFNPSASVTNVSCFGGNNGSITVTNVNATAPFQYSMNGINFQNSNVFSNLTAGAYTITVKDANGCTGFVSKTIAQPTQLLATLNSVQSTCYGSATGAINISVSGGTTAYSYQWTGPNGYSSTQLNISSLAAGDYFFTVTDNKGCQANLNVAVPNYNVINVTGTRTNVICKGDANGTIDLTVSGGTNSGFSYLWNDLVTTTQDRVNLARGYYQVTITDIGSGCTVIRKDTITQPDNLLKLQNPVISSVKGCAAADLGSILASATGGSTPYQFKLGNGAYQSSNEFTGLNAGFYRVWVKDLNGCEKYLDVEVTDNGNEQYETCIAGKNNNNNKNNACTISTGTTISARIGKAGDADWFKFTISSTGNYTVTLSHPSSSILFAVSAGTGPAPILVGSTATSRTYTFGLGTYYVNVFGATSTDFSLTCYQLSVTTTAPLKSSGSKPQNEIAAMAEKESFDIKAFPNPSGSYFNLKVETGRNEKMSLRVVDITGRVIEERLNLQPQQMIRLGDRYLNGVYIAEIIQGGKRKVIRLLKM